MLRRDRGGKACLEFGRKLAPVRQPHALGVGVDAFGDHRPGEPSLAQRARGECHDRSGQCRERTGRRIGRTPDRADLILGHIRRERADQFGLRRK